MLDPVQLTPYYNIALCDALASAGCQVRYITSSYLYEDALPFTGRFQTDYLYFRAFENPILVKFPLLRRVLRGVGYPIGHWQLLQQIKQSPPDIVHIQWSRLPRFDRWLVQAIKRLGIPVVHTIHEVIPPYESEQITPALEAVYKEVDAVVVHTTTNQQDFQKIYSHVQPDRITIIPFITSPYSAFPEDSSSQTARLLSGLPGDAVVFLFFGSIRHYKGLDILLDAFAQVVLSCPNAQLVIAGLPETAQDKALLEKACQQFKVQVRSGYIPYEEMWRYYAASDVAVLPYRAITQSAALMTAMEFGRAVIVTAVGGLPESVDGNGWVVPPEDAEALAGAMLEAASDRERLHKMGELSAALVRERYDGAAVARQTIQLYKQVLERSHPTGENKS